MLGEELRKYRMKAGLSQEKLAFEADVDRTYISQLENNKKSPTVDLLFRLCDAMGVKPSVLIENVDQQRRKMAGAQVGAKKKGVRG